MTKRYTFRSFSISMFLLLYIMQSATVPAVVFAQESSSSATPAASEPTVIPTIEPTVSAAQLQLPSPTLPILPSSPAIETIVPAISQSPTPVPETQTAQPTETNQPDAPTPTIDRPQPSIGIESATIRKPMKAVPPRKRLFSSTEAVQVEMVNVYRKKLSVELRHERRGPITASIREQTHGNDATITVIPPAQFVPGKYQLRISDEQGNTQQQDFTWGVLAINPDKSVYEPGETAKLALAVLDEHGSMVCSAHMGVEITTPSGIKTTLGTWDRTITINPECEIHDVTTKPDYEADYPIGTETGRYSIKVTAETRNGTWTITDGFDVRTSPPFVINRNSATRIVPTKQYAMTLTVKARQDFTGTVTETVPGSFTLSQPADSSVLHYDTVASVSASLPETASASSPSSIPIGPLGRPYQESYSQTLGFGEIPENPLLQKHYKKFGLPAHDGIDIALPEGTPVLAVDDGEVLFARDGPYGITVILRHRWGQSYYGHLSKAEVEVLQKVKKGEEIALSGSTGFTTGPHLHFAIRPEAAAKTNGYFGKVDPLPYLQDHQELDPGYAATTVQRISWNVSMRAGETKMLGYVYDAPDVSPQFYLVGPARLEEKLTTVATPTGPALSPDFSVETIPSLVFSATESATLATGSAEIASPSASSPPAANILTATPTLSSSESAKQKPATESAVLGIEASTALFAQSFTLSPNHEVYQESRRWQIAADADVVIDGNVSITQTRNKDKPHMVFISDQIGYKFYTNTGAFDCSYMKTTDGGATWGTETNVIANGCNTTVMWYDRWTPGDNTGTYIHVLGFDETNNDLIYNRLDTANGADTLLGVTIADNPTATLSDGDTMAITKSTSGVLYAGYTDGGGAGVSKIRQCSTSCGTAGNWSDVGTSPLDQANDYIRLLPLSGGNIMLIQDDISADTLRYNTWNGSTWAGWTNIDTTFVDDTSYDEAFAATLRRWNNNIYLVYVPNVAAAGTADIRTALYNGSSWTQKTEVLSNQNTVVNADIAVDEESGDVYVIYSRGATATTTNVYYKKSTDGMVTWGDEVQLNTSNANGDNRYVWLNMVSSDRIYFAYVLLTGAEIYGGTVNNLTPPVLDEIMKHGDWFSRTGIRKSFSF